MSDPTSTPPASVLEMIELGRIQPSPTNPRRSCVEFLLERWCPTAGKRTVCVLRFVEVPVGQVCEPTFTVSYDKAQILMDDLWVAGLRPTEGTGSAGALKATERHLEDMRRLVFDRPEDRLRPQEAPR